MVRQRPLRRADRSSGGVLPSVVCPSVIARLQQYGGLGPMGGLSSHDKKKCLLSSVFPKNHHQTNIVGHIEIYNLVPVLFFF